VRESSHYFVIGDPFYVNKPCKTTTDQKKTPGTEAKKNKAIPFHNTWDRFANQPRSCSSQFAAL
jgi:CRISPR/Cas system CSM-associated protein Csm4 (group 5 of RAMP superfamily)